MSPYARFDGVVFDLDGTLVETAPDLCRALNHALAAAGRPPLPLDDVRLMVGEGARTLVQRGLAAAGDEPAEDEIESAVEALLATYWDHVADESAPFPGVVEVLEAFASAGTKMAVCTNKPIRLTEKLLRELDLRRWFDAVLGGDSLPVRKPHARHLLAALDLIGVSPGRAVMIGDSVNDVKLARNAGVPVVVVSFGYTVIPPRDLGADAVIDSFAELAGALARLSEKRSGSAI